MINILEYQLSEKAYSVSEDLFNGDALLEFTALIHRDIIDPGIFSYHVSCFSLFVILTA